MDVKGVALRAARRVDASGPGPSRNDPVAVEEPLEIRVAGEPLAITMRTPGNDAELAAGFLFAEGIVRSREDLGSVAVCGRPGEEGYGNVIDVVPAPGVVLDVERVATSRRGTLTTAACGVCGRRSVDDLFALAGPVPDGPALPRALVAGAPEALRGAQENFARTGGVHAAALLDAAGKVLAVFEDVGRHNAVDKAVGSLLLTGAISRASERTQGAAALLVVSGRSSFEIVQKAAMAGVGVVASVSAASSLAVDLADRSRIALASFVRDGAFNLHTHPSRISVTVP